MSTFNELILIPRSEYEKFNLKGQNVLENELRDIDKNKSKLNSHQKHVTYKKKLGEFLNSSKNLREPIKINVKKAYTPLLNNVPEEDLLVQRLSKFPKERRKSIYTIYNKLLSLPGVSEGEKNVMIHGKRLNHSLLDYVAEGLQPETRKQPFAGYPHVVKLMQEAKIQMPTIVHRHYQKRLKKFRNKDENLDDSQIGSGTRRCIDFNSWIKFRF